MRLWKEEQAGRENHPIVFDLLCLSGQREIYIEIIVIIQKSKLDSGRSTSWRCKFEFVSKSSFHREQCQMVVKKEKKRRLTRAMEKNIIQEK